MPLINPPLPNDGEDINASDVNDPLNAIIGLLNGGLDDSNIASVSGTKITAGTLPATALDTAAQTGWLSTGETWAIGANNGSKEFTVTTTGDKTAKYSPGMRFKVTRATVAPTQCVDLESSSSQYATKSSPTGLVFTDDWTCEAWVKLESYSANGQVIGRGGVTGDWAMRVNANGQIEIYGTNASSNGRIANSVQAIPLNVWVHIAATLDMSGSASTMYINGTSVTTIVGNLSAGASALVQANDVYLGKNSGSANYFDGKITDVRVWSAIRTAQQIKDNMCQQLTGAESGLVLYYKLNGDFNDSTSNANNLSAQNSAVATTVDNPMNLTEYATILAVSYSNPSTTLILDTGSVGTIPALTLTNASYSTQHAPFGFPVALYKYRRTILLGQNFTQTSTSATLLSSGTLTMTLPTNALARIIAFIPFLYNDTAGKRGTFSIWDGTVGTGVQLTEGHGQAASGFSAPSVSINALYQGSGAKTFNLGLCANDSGTAKIDNSGFFLTSFGVEVDM